MPTVNGSRNVDHSIAIPMRTAGGADDLRNRELSRLATTPTRPTTR
jgi:hypothetical protein